ncbi:MAG: sugar phosphate nucleotidyltransferase, partial [Candidatus Aenigmarchaeota archaeon]|nr:sugar phosphate nucleotidyltransferase [Candidatus Aenigmarchaeota archaeon]MDI6722362.1 sugar phosphate nucleotidyltransferase [Candidatus Aenigmarchaeota archaeon]
LGGSDSSFAGNNRVLSLSSLTTYMAKTYYNFFYNIIINFLIIIFKAIGQIERMQTVILSAGLGTRLEPLTNGTSKGMLPIANKPILHWIASKFDDVVIVARKEQKDVLDCFSDRTIVIQKEAKGTANALLQCENEVDDDFIMVNGDDLFLKDDTKRFVRSKECAIAVAQHKKPEKFGTVEADGKKVGKILEKHDSPKSSLVSCGMYRFNKDIFKHIRKTPLSKRGEYEITDSINLAIKDGMEFEAIEVKEWQTVSYPWDILDANRKILEETESIISKTAEIRPGSCIEEPVAIGDNAIIGPNCYIRKYSSIGANCKIGNAVEIKNSIIMDASFVSHLSYVGDSIVGKNCNIGAGTIFANLRLDDKEVKMNIKGERVETERRKLGSIIGDNVKAGVNVTLMPGRRIWPNMMIPPCAIIKDDVKEQPSLKL